MFSGSKVIDPSNPTWRPIRLENDESVEYLNRMFKQGWYLMPINADDISYLIMMVPLKPPKYINPKSTHQRVVIQNEQMMTIVVLRKGNQKGFQRAELMKRSDSGYVEMGDVKTDITEWGTVAMLNLETGDMVVILERGRPEK